MCTLLLSLLPLVVVTNVSSQNGCSSDSTVTNKTKLYFSLIASINPTTGFSSAGVIPAMHIALDIVNNSTEILPQYHLCHSDILDSKCQQTAALDAFFKHFTDDDNHTYISTVCCGCSVATIPVAEVSHYWNIPQLSYSTALVLNDRTRFRNYFRLVPTNKNLGPGMVRMMEHFQWHKLMVITQNEELFIGLRGNLHQLLVARNWLIDATILIESIDHHSFSAKTIFNKIQTEHYRIIFINTYSYFARAILCEAFLNGMHAPKYIWMTYMWYNRDWWKFTDINVQHCTDKNMQTVLSGSIGIIPDGFTLTEGTAPTTSGLTVSEFLDEYSELVKTFHINNQTVDPVNLPNVGFDLIWTLATGLDAAAKRVNQNNDSGCEHKSGDVVKLEDFDYSNSKMGCILRQSMESVKFNGFSGKMGKITFNSNGSQKDNLILVQQYRLLESGDIEWITVAKVDVINDSFLYTNDTLLWKYIPYDGYPRQNIVNYHIALFVVYNGFAFAGIIFAVVCLFFNLVFRNKKVLKLSSPNLNYLIIFGSAVLYMCVFLYTYMPSSVDSTLQATIVCNLRIWLFSFGYTLCFAVILSKTWRVYHSFNHPSPNKKVIKDWMLVIMVLVLVLGDVVIHLIGTLVKNFRIEATKIRSSDTPIMVTDDFVYENYIYVCLQSRTGSIVWLSISFGYKGLLQIMGIFMSFYTRKVKIKALNDSKQMAVIVYVNTIVLITMAVSLLALDIYQDGLAAIFGLGLLIDATLFLGALFVPKMVTLIHDPSEKKLSVNQHAQQNVQSQKRKPILRSASMSEL